MWWVRSKDSFIRMTVWWAVPNRPLYVSKKGHHWWWLSTRIWDYLSSRTRPLEGNFGIPCDVRPSCQVGNNSNSTFNHILLQLWDLPWPNISELNIVGRGILYKTPLFGDSVDFPFKATRCIITLLSDSKSLSCQVPAGFLKWGYPQIIHSKTSICLSDVPW